MALQFDAPHVEETLMLTPNQLYDFYTVMKKSVWKVEVDDQFYSGVCIDQNGLILTTYLGVGEVFVHGPNEESFEADLVYSENNFGLSLVKPKCPYVSAYVEFSTRRRIDVGQHIYAIVFPNIASSAILLTGHLAYRYDPDFANVGFITKYRTMETLPAQAACLNKDWSPELKLSSDIRLLQLARLGATTEYQGRRDEYDFINKFGLEEGRGAPIFDSGGHLLGLVAFQSVGFDFAIHVDDINVFFSRYVSSIEPGKEKVEPGEEKVGPGKDVGPSSVHMCKVFKRSKRSKFGRR